jgi:hypothetical protein
MYFAKSIGQQPFDVFIGFFDTLNDRYPDQLTGSHKQSYSSLFDEK